MIKNVNFQQADELLRKDPACVLLDVREEEEYITGHAVNAQLLPLDEITGSTAAAVIPTPDTPVLVYCRTGNRSKAAAGILAALGYTRVYDMGGLVGWPYGLE